MRTFDRALYLLLAAVATLFAARAFYSYMLVQTGGEWSAPLDDVFIHFDYARAAARGYPFQWSEGNGYSSGNTSLLYPFALSLGYLVGFTGQSLMIWAALVACLCVFALLLAIPRLFEPLPPSAKYLAIPALFSVGALDWSLFSGMEVAFFLGVWALAYAAALARIDGFCRPPATEPWRTLAPWWLGLAGVLVVWTRPEGATSIAALGSVVALARLRRDGWRAGLFELACAGAPPIAALVVQAIANRAFTGEWSANGAIVKLALYNPYMPWRAKLDEYLFLLEYVVRRNVEHHFSVSPRLGWLVPGLAAVPLVCRGTRRQAIVLWVSALAWLLMVATNGQVRWQNERYTMPAVAWVLMLAAMGLGVLTSGFAAAPLALLRAGTSKARAALALAGALLAAALVGVFAVNQAPCMRDQIWFFGRASRNIRDQHIVTGRKLAELEPKPKRVMVGDAGALLYASDRPGLDLIGLGGYHELPFARAGVHGLGATLELLERMPQADWPDLMAIYPSWWGDLPNWFGRELFQVEVHGNVICGGAEKVVYRTDWRALGHGAKPAGLGDHDEVVDELDVADLVSEREHRYEFPHPDAGFVEFRVLPDPTRRAIDLFDAGRRIPEGRSESFRMRARGRGPARLVARTVAEHPARVGIKIDGQGAGALALEPADGWRELRAELPVLEPTHPVQIELTCESGGDWVDHHVWLVQSP